MKVVPVLASELYESVQLLEKWLRDGELVPNDFIGQLQHSVEVGDVEVLVARQDGRAVGVLVLAYRLNVALGGHFASIEDFYVTPEARRKGVGRALLEAVGERCAARGISYVEAQVEGQEARAFYRAIGYEVEPGVRVLSLSLPIDRDLEADARDL